MPRPLAAAPRTGSSRRCSPRHLQAGNIRRIARGVFASVPKHADAATWSVDRFLAASRLRLGGTIAYHSALELQGYAYTEGA